MRRIMTAALAATVLAACAPDTAGPAAASDEMLFALQAESMAREVAASTQTTYDDWLRRLFAALRETDDPEAQACLAEARDLRQQARAAYEAGDRALARELLRESFRKVLCAVVEVFPNAAERTGAAVDDVIARIEARLGDRDAPRVRRLLAHVVELRALAEAALAEGNEIDALALNLRAIQILRRFVAHVRDGHRDHDEVADGELHDVGL